MWRGTHGVALMEIVLCEGDRKGDSATFVTGWYLRERSSRHWCRGRSWSRSGQEAAFQILSRERLGEQVGRTVLAFRVGHRDLSAFCHVAHEEGWFRCVSSFGVLVREREQRRAIWLSMRTAARTSWPSSSRKCLANQVSTKPDPIA